MTGLRWRNIAFLNPKDKWAGLRTIGLVEAERTIGNQTSTEHRYYISSLAGESVFLKLI
jgi:hypothetical protein